MIGSSVFPGPGQPSFGIVVVVVEDHDQSPPTNNKKVRDQDQSPPLKGDLAKHTHLSRVLLSGDPLICSSCRIFFHPRFPHTSQEALDTIFEKDLYCLNNLPETKKMNIFFETTLYTYKTAYVFSLVSWTPPPMLREWLVLKRGCTNCSFNALCLMGSCFINTIYIILSRITILYVCTTFLLSKIFIYLNLEES